MIYPHATLSAYFCIWIQLDKAQTRRKQVFLPSSTHFSSIMQPSFPKVTIANLSLGNLKIIETSALGIDDASVQACQIVTHKS